MRDRFVEIDHSGDVGIEAYGTSMSELVVNVTRGLFALMCRGAVEARVERRLRVSSGSPEELVIDWLNEVIAEGATRGEVYAGVEVEVAGNEAAGQLFGEAADERKHDLRFDVKAATYHGLTLEREEGRYTVRVIFDL